MRVSLPPLINALVDDARKLKLDWQRWIQDLSVSLGHSPAQRIWTRQHPAFLLATDTSTATFTTLTLPRLRQASDDDVSGFIVLPHSFDGIRSVVPYFRYLSPTAGGAGDMVLHLDYQVLAPGVTASATPTVEDLTVAGTAAGIASTLVEFSPVASDDLAPGSVFVFRVQREGTHVDDTYDRAAHVIEVGLAAGIYGIGRVTKYA